MPSNRSRSRSPLRRRKDDSGRDRSHRLRYKESHRSTNTDRDRPSRRDHDKRKRRIDDDMKDSLPTSNVRDAFADKQEEGKKPAAEKKAMLPTEPTIVVNVNDRLGSKAAIPCLASDSVALFRKLVAAHIGRKPEEILLKRQGERPFKDQLTLEDYGISNGVQLDLEIDTRD